MFFKKNICFMLVVLMCLTSPIHTTRTSDFPLQQSSSLWWDNWAFLIGSALSLAGCSVYGVHKKLDRGSTPYQFALSVIMLSGGALFHYYRNAIKESYDYIHAIPAPLKGLLIASGIYLAVKKIQSEREKSLFERRLLNNELSIAMLLGSNEAFGNTLNQALSYQKSHMDMLIEHTKNKDESLREILQKKEVLISLCDYHQELLDDARFKEVMQRAEVVEKNRQNRKL